MSRRQHCSLVNLYLNWIVYVGGFVALLWIDRYALAAVWLVGTPLIQGAYVRGFPRISAALGYGSVADDPATVAGPISTDVTLYTAVGCPFCPLVEQRLRALQPTLGFRLDIVDVTGRPEILARKGIRAVPVVEVPGATRVGHLTSRELAALIAGAAEAA